LAFREALAERLSRESTKLRRLLGAREFVQLITCNRIEILIAAGSTDAVERSFLAWLSKTPRMEDDSVYVYRDVDAIAHIFRVASGLTSRRWWK